MIGEARLDVCHTRILGCLWRGAWFDRLTSGDKSGESWLNSPPKPCVSEFVCTSLPGLRGQGKVPPCPRKLTGGVLGVETRHAVRVRICVTHPVLPYGYFTCP